MRTASGKIVLCNTTGDWKVLSMHFRPLLIIEPDKFNPYAIR